MNNFDRRKKRLAVAGWLAAGGWAVLLLVLSSLPKNIERQMSERTAEMVESFFNMLFNTPISPSKHTALVKIASVGIILFGYAVLSLLLWNNLRIRGLRRRRALILSFAATAFFSVIDELHLLFLPGRLPDIGHWLPGILASALTLSGVMLFHWSWKRFPRAVNRETVSYVFFGALTTLVNMIVYGLCYNTLSIHNLVSNVLAWVAAVLFAYAVNKIFVFRSHTADMRQAAREFGLFIGARVFSLAVDELGMWLLVNILGANGGLSKIGMNIIVLIMNYFFSKRIIFLKKTDG